MRVISKHIDPSLSKLEIQMDGKTTIYPMVDHHECDMEMLKVKFQTLNVTFIAKTKLSTALKGSESPKRIRGVCFYI
jgi:hypothetical protein